MNVIGIDKTVVRSFYCTSIDMQKLLSASNTDNVVCIRNSPNKFHYWNESREDNFNTIIIKDNYEFNNLKIDVKKVNDKFIKYAVLDMSIATKGQNNLVPLSTRAYKQKINKVFDYIKDRYGIEIDTSEIKFKQVEFNATIELDKEFDSYVRALKVMMSLAPRTYSINTVLSNHSKNKINMYEVSNNSIKCKFYDKSEQLKDVYDLDIDKSLLRIEYTLKNEKKIKSIFKTDLINSFTDADIKEFVKNQFTNDFIKNWKKGRKENKSKLIKLCKQYKKDYKQWLQPFLMHVMNREISNDILLYDLEDLKEVFKAVDKTNYNRYMKAIDKLPKGTISSYIGVNKKINEILQKMNEI